MQPIDLNLSTPIYTLIGVLIGGLLSFIASWFLKSREAKLKISSLLVEKRIEAHEKLLILTKSMRGTLSLGKLNVEKEYITYPIIFSTKDDYDNWRSGFYIISNEYSHWLNYKVLRELYFIQDYIVNLDKRLEKAPDCNYLQIGIILKNDFIEMSKELENAVIDFFDKSWRSIGSIKESKSNKISNKSTIDRLNKTNLFQRHLEINKFLYSENSTIPKGDIKKFTELYNIAPNGLKTNIIQLKEVPNIDNSGVEYELTYIENEGFGKPVRFGHCELICGNIMFDKLDSDAIYLGVDYKAMSLLTKWIEENLDEFEFDNVIVN